MNRDQKITPKPKAKCLGFSYNGSKLLTRLPSSLKKAFQLLNIQVSSQDLYWENIPSF